ncbi:SpoIID/LytB domain-containing protein [Mesobacillus selenatarsenatis]|uniref:Stage II sporulation protein D (SpoIID) n=1 Tax=Mesobacillus selenatarsenatis (strain DSM 18680 / JCM 14380 / FERM P-15431 / SF-1) TaxID=1321606 RepID=A0A0A8WYI5_MESS1|nr:SpoIID/LytB domain-containing protein [Mesobacillus selenatarsenatis]GAM12014.1 stage II sporulation protein D (SpoIID) [Mesobacillus selenatarsenatis SF-1]
MKQIYKQLILLIAVFLLASTFSGKSTLANSEPIVKVKLVNYLGNKTSIPLKITGEYLLDGTSLTSGNQYYVKNENGKIAIYHGSKLLKSSDMPLTITPKEYGQSHYANINGRNYLGTMRFTKEGSYVRPVNELSMEDYLKGVVPAEMPASWSLEALKAQAIAARTYIKARISQVIDDTVKYQAYSGYTWNSSYYAKTNQAVNDTAGQVLTHNGRLISAVYSSSNGGHTESNSNYWGSAKLPYLPSKPDPYDPKIEWNITLNKEQISLSGLDLSQPQLWWGQVREKAQGNELLNINYIKSYIRNNYHPNTEIKVTGIPKVGVGSGYTLADSGTTTGKRTTGTLHVEYIMKDSSGNYVRDLPGNLPDNYSTTLGGPSRYHTSVDISEKGWPSTASAVVLGRGDIHVDAITGTVLAKKLNSPLLLTKSDEVPSVVLERIKELQPSTVYLLGGESAIDSSSENQLKTMGYNVERINGASRYHTALKIADQIGAFSEVFITSGDENSPDALSIASYAASKQIPIILTAQDKLLQSTLDTLKKHQVNKVTIIGGESAVSTGIVDQLKSSGIGDVSRIEGPSRYHTSIEIAKRLSFDTNTLYFAQGQTFIDALPGAVLASKSNAPVILTEKDSLSYDAEKWIKSLGIRPSVVYLGSEAAISETARQEIKNALIGDIKVHVMKKDNVGIGVLRAMMGGTLFKSYHIDNVNETSTQFAINGKGFGHGVGMSQYGAKKMAELGKPYQEILGHYYPGSVITK